MHTGCQQALELAVNGQQAGVVLRHQGHKHAVVTAYFHAAAQDQRGDFLGECRRDHVLVGDIDFLETQVDITLPVQTPRVGCQHFGQHAVFVAQADFSRAGFNPMQHLRYRIGLGLLQIVRELVLKQRLGYRIFFDRVVMQRIEHSVFARQQKLHEVAFAKQQSTLVFLHIKLSKQHGTFPSK